MTVAAKAAAAITTGAKSTAAMTTAAMTDAADSVATAVARLRSPATIRERSRRIADAVLAGRSPWFDVRPERLDSIAAEVAVLTGERYPDLRVPGHSRWRHFETGGIDRHGPLRRRLAQQHGNDRGAIARALIDLAVVSVLLDAGAGPDWRYREPATGLVVGRSEGLALASLDAFAAGLFSSAPQADPLRVDAAALAAIDEASLGRALQVSPSNPLVGLAGRVRLLNALGAALAARADLFGSLARPGGLHDHLLRHRAPGGAVTATAVLGAILDGFAPIWPHGARIAGQPLGDCWPHPALGPRAMTAPRPQTGPETGPETGRDAASAPAAEPGLDAGLVPFHKLSQWLAYSLLEPFEWVGRPIVDVEALTGLPEYRNGGLLIDGGLLVPRPALVAAGPLAVDAEPVIEWRALTVAWLDELAVAVRRQLAPGATATATASSGNESAARLPLAAILEGGTWACGRRLAARLRDGSPPLPIVSDGTVF